MSDPENTRIDDEGTSRRKAMANLGKVSLALGGGGSVPLLAKHLMRKPEVEKKNSAKFKKPLPGGEQKPESMDHPAEKDAQWER